MSRRQEPEVHTPAHVVFGCDNCGTDDLAIRTCHMCHRDLCVDKCAVDGQVADQFGQEDGGDDEWFCKACWGFGEKERAWIKKSQNAHDRLADKQLEAWQEKAEHVRYEKSGERG